MRPLTDRDYIGLTLYGEARGESTLGKLAVASVFRNRLRTHRWGQTYQEVCLAPKQFSCWNATDPNRDLLMALADALREDRAQQGGVLREVLWIADGLLAGAFPSVVGDATHYYASSMSKPPAWAAEGRLVAEVGHHRFYSHVR